WTTSPAGLSTTTRSASSYTTGTGTAGSGAGPAGAGASGTVISRVSPSATRCVRAVTGRPSTSTAPPSTSSAASDRLRPVTRATTRSSRWPSRARGPAARTARAVGRGAGVGVPVGGGGRGAGVAPLGPEEQRRADDDGRVGQVEHRPPLQVDEVDDAAAEEPVPLADGAVDQVAQRAAEHHAQRDGHDRPGGVAPGAQQDGHHDDRQQRDQRAPPVGEAERRAVVGDVAEAQGADQLDDVAVTQGGDGPRLRGLVEGEGDGGDPEQQRPSGTGPL